MCRVKRVSNAMRRARGMFDESTGREGTRIPSQTPEKLDVADTDDTQEVHTHDSAVWSWVAALLVLTVTRWVFSALGAI